MLTEKPMTHKIFTFPSSQTAPLKDPIKEKLKTPRKKPELPKKRDTLDLVFSSQSSPKTQGSSPAKSTRQTQQDPAFIFLKRKQIVDFLRTDHIVKNSHTLKKSPTINKPQQDEIELEYAPFTRKGTMDSPRFLRTSSMMYSGGSSPASSPKKEATETTGPTLKKVYVDLLASSDAQNSLMRFNPMSAKSLLTEKGEPTNRMIETIKNLHHRMFGIDHINLKRINSLLRTKFEPPTPGNIISPIKVMTSPRNRIVKRTSQPSIPSLAKVTEIKEEEEVPGIIKEENYNVYEYDAVTDDFQIRDLDMEEIAPILNSLMTPKYHIMDSVKNFHSHRGERSSLKSQTLPVGVVSETTQVSVDRGIIRKSQFQTSYPLLPKIKGLNTSKIRSRNLPLGVKPVLVKGGEVKFVHIPQETVEEQKGKILQRAIKMQREGKGTPRNELTGTEQGLKKIEDLCEKLGKQNKKMLRNVRKNKKKIRKDFNKLNKQAGKIKDRWLTEEPY